MRFDRRPIRWSAALAALAIVAVGRCGSRQPSPPPATELPASCSVARLADGDSLTCAGGFELRLIGIDAPELSQRPFGSRSRQALQALLAGRALRLEYDVETLDRFGRRLAYAWIGPLFVNEKLVRDGWAVAFNVPPNARYRARLDAAENAARAAPAGHWATGGFTCLPADHRAGRC